MRSWSAGERLPQLTEYPDKWKRFLIVAVGVFMSTLDSSMVNIALPTIMHHFRSPMPATQWVVLAYLLTITASLLFWGHLGDRVGRGRIYALGMLIFAGGSLACALAPGLALLVASRFGQALGAAMMMSTGPAIIRDSFPPEQLGRSLGLVGIAVSLGLMSGPGLGGLLIQWFSWRALFYITVPFGVIFCGLAARYLPRVRPAGPAEAIDWTGSVLLAATLSLGTLMLTGLSDHSWSPVAILLTILATPPLLAWFLASERRTRAPILPLDLFADRYFFMGVASATLSFATLFAAIILAPFYLERLRQLAPAHTGLIMMAIPATIMLVSPLAGWLSDHRSKTGLATLGLAIASLGMFLLAATTAATTLAAFTARLALLGIGQSLFLSPNSAAVLAHSPRSRTGTASALLATGRNLGMMLGIALATLAFTKIFRHATAGLDLMDYQPGDAGAFLTAWRGTMLGGGMIGLAGMLASWLRGDGGVVIAAEKGEMAERRADGA